METNVKKEVYEKLLIEIEALISNEFPLISNLSNITSVLKEKFQWWWVGFYIVEDGKMFLGPFQGPLACMSIPYGKGVCGKAWKEKETLIVPDVTKFPGHIACSSLSRSEIVVPILDENNEVKFVLDIDSRYLSTFDDIDAYYLKKIANMINNLCKIIK
ncbi:MAG: GAF domain-containing protein [Bacteroidales bacterium]